MKNCDTNPHLTFRNPQTPTRHGRTGFSNFTQSDIRFSIGTPLPSSTMPVFFLNCLSRYTFCPGKTTHRKSSIVIFK
jgi:hypothetical protein